MMSKNRTETEASTENLAQWYELEKERKIIFFLNVARTTFKSQNGWFER